ncbi:MAG: radical SAM family heme chaperone HemW [Clostridia bacterium]|nr:radical SAM family heme chaperone HemW [Clostridia bacterium]
MKTKPIGLYVHIPFCIKKCAYCDFCSFPTSSVDISLTEEYVDALVEEIESYRELNLTLDTVFIGGGTPSLLSVHQLAKIMRSVEKAFRLLPNTEVTLEANPATELQKKALDLKTLGVNRISIGLQSIHENELKILGRIHSYNDFLDTYKAVRDAGIGNVNVDLMYAIPEQTLMSLDKTLSEIISHRPEHISLYSLILEEGTPLYNKRPSLTLPSEDEECDMYYHAAEKLRGAGYSHYEISNYSLNSRECRHNLKYWHCEDYIGVGLAAHSCFQGVRYANTTSLSGYINDKSHRRIKSDVLSFDDRRFEYAMLGLRLKEGISLSEYEKSFGEDFMATRTELVTKLSVGGYLTVGDGRISLTEQGFYVSNHILAELI